MTMLGLLATGLMHAPPMDGHSVNHLSRSTFSEFDSGCRWAAQTPLAQIVANHDLYDQGINLLLDGKFAEAEAIFWRIIDVNLMDAETHTVLAIALTHQNRLDEAIAALSTALDLDPGLVSAYDTLGNAYALQGNYEDSIAQFQQAIALNPNDANLHNNLGATYQELGRLDEATESYEKALRLNPNHITAHSNLERVERAEPIRSTLSTIALPMTSPAEAQQYYAAGNALLEQGNLTAAIAAYQQALQIDPNQPEYYNSLGIALRRHGQLDAAVDAYHQALRLNDQLPEVHANLATVLLAQGRQQEAIAALRQAQALLYEQGLDQDAHQLEMVIHQLEGG